MKTERNVGRRWGGGRNQVQEWRWSALVFWICLGRKKGNISYINLRAKKKQWQLVKKGALHDVDAMSCFLFFTYFKFVRLVRDSREIKCDYACHSAIHYFPIYPLCYLLYFPMVNLTKKIRANLLYVCAYSGYQKIIVYY